MLSLSDKNCGTRCRKSWDFLGRVWSGLNSMGLTSWSQHTKCSWTDCRGQPFLGQLTPHLSVNIHIFCKVTCDIIFFCLNPTDGLPVSADSGPPRHLGPLSLGVLSGTRCLHPGDLPVLRGQTSPEDLLKYHSLSFHHVSRSLFLLSELGSILLVTRKCWATSGSFL